MCGKRCTRKADLQVHMRSHTGERPYQCRYCKKSYVTSSYVKVHERRHIVDGDMLPTQRQPTPVAVVSNPRSAQSTALTPTPQPPPAVPTPLPGVTPCTVLTGGGGPMMMLPLPGTQVFVLTDGRRVFPVSYVPGPGQAPLPGAHPGVPQPGVQVGGMPQYPFMWPMPAPTAGQASQ